MGRGMKLVFSLLLLGASVCYATPQCSTVYETIWVIEYEDKYEKVCQTMTETYKDQVCKDHPNIMVETYTERVCMTETGRHCLMVWVVDQYGNKNYEEDPDNCHSLPETVCEDQEKTRNKVVIEKKCKPVRKYRCKEECETVHTRIPKSVGKKSPKQVCSNYRKDELKTVLEQSDRIITS